MSDPKEAVSTPAVSEERDSGAGSGPLAGRIYAWFVPDDNGKPATTGAIPIQQGEQLNNIIAPIMPMYDLPTASVLIPLGENGLNAFLTKHKHLFPVKRYRRIQKNRRQRRIRLLSADEINMIREHIFIVKHH